MITREFLVAMLVASSAAGCAPALHLHPQTAPALFAEPKANEIAFWGHACSYIDLDGFGIATDPVFMDRWAVVRRRLIPVPPPEVYDQTRVVLISHAHHDHLDPATLARFPANTVILAPAPAAKHLLRRGIRAIVMKPGSEFRIPGGSIIAVAAYHPGGRRSLKSRADGRALGYVIRTAKATIYYTGDTKYFRGFAAVGAEHRPDIVLLNLSRHLHSSDALRAIADLGAPVVIPTHYGAYSGPSARLGPQWRDELIRALGPVIVPLEVGEAVGISSLTSAASPALREGTPPCAPR